MNNLLSRLTEISRKSNLSIITPPASHLATAMDTMIQLNTQIPKLGQECRVERLKKRS